MESQNIPSAPQKKFNGLLFLEVGLVEVFSVIFVLLLIFGTLNYFGILSISESFPFLSFLPKQQKIITISTKSAAVPNPPPSIQSQLAFLSCPISEAACRNGILIAEPRGKIDSFSGIAFLSLSKNEPILSAIDGNIKFSTEEASPSGLAVITIENKERNIIATYELPKDSFKAGTSSAKVKEKEVIATLTNNNRTINEFGKKFNLLFYARVLNTKTYVKIKPSADGKSLLNID